MTLLFLNSQGGEASPQPGGKSLESGSSSSTPSPPQKEGLYHPESKRLANGLEIVVISNSLSPVISMALVYKVGTADDPADQVGLSHFLEHLMFKGTQKFPGGSFKETLTQKGIRINAWTSFDATVYTADLAKEHLPLVLEMEADRMAYLVFEEKSIQSEQKVVFEERLMRMDNDPLGQGYEALLKALYPYHPYGVPPIGYPHHIQAYTPRSAQEHYRTWYRPNNAVLILSGDITMDQAWPLVEKFFGALPSAPVPLRKRPQDPQSALWNEPTLPPPAKNVSQMTHRIEVSNPRISHRMVLWCYSAPTYRSSFAYPLMVLSQILGGGTTSRLYKALVIEAKTVLDVTAHYSPFSVDPMNLSLTLTLAPEARIEDVQIHLQKALEAMLETGVTAQDLQDAMDGFSSTMVFAKDGPQGAIRLFSDVVCGISVHELDSLLHHLRQVTAEEVHQAARSVLSQSPLVSLLVLPKQ